jgi:DNA-binding IscR family transcriptional regulator
MVLLTGAEVAFATQIWRRYQHHLLPLTPVGRLGLAFEIISNISANYHQKKVATRDSLVAELKQPDVYVSELLDTLSGADFLRKIEGEGEGYVLSAPISDLKVLDVGNLIMGELPSPISMDNPAIKVSESIKRSLVEQEPIPDNFILKRKSDSSPDEIDFGRNLI